MANYSFDVFDKILPNDRVNWKLYIDAVYRADPAKKNLGSEVLSKLLGVKNQGGFRYLGSTKSPKLVVLYSTGEDIYWRDEMENSIGLFLYYGDNKTPGNDLHKTNLHGNEILRDVFLWAASNDINIRKKIPPILVFKKSGGRNVKFLGLAVPGIKGKPTKDWLTAVWGANRSGDRFQNYKAFFTILNTASGCSAEDGFGINLGWLNDIEQGNAFDSQYAPNSWKAYIHNRSFSPLIARSEKFRRTKAEQLPSTLEQQDMLRTLQQHFIGIDGGYSFEKFAAYLIECMDEAIEYIDVTRPYKDGGFDAEGQYKIFKHAENSVHVSFYMQAKCYKQDNPITTKDMSRLIARIKDRQFGIMITTSYVAEQAYKEVLEDGHPIVIICGRDIIDYIYNELEIRDKDVLKEWLDLNYSSSQ